MSKRRIAILISMLLAAPAAVVALEQSAATSEAMEPPQEIQATASEPVPTTEAVVVDQTTVAEVTVPASEPSASGNWQRSVASNTFPRGSTDSDDASHSFLPAQLAYLERLEQQRGSMIALGTSFPAGTNGDEGYQQLPRQVAYFNGIEQLRMARVPSQDAIASSEVQARSGEESAQAGSAELALSSVR